MASFSESPASIMFVTAPSDADHEITSRNPGHVAGRRPCFLEIENRLIVVLNQEWTPRSFDPDEPHVQFRRHVAIDRKVALLAVLRRAPRQVDALRLRIHPVLGMLRISPLRAPVWYEITSAIRAYSGIIAQGSILLVFKIPFAHIVYRQHFKMWHPKH